MGGKDRIRGWLGKNGEGEDENGKWGCAAHMLIEFFPIVFRLLLFIIAHPAFEIFLVCVFAR